VLEQGDQYRNADRPEHRSGLNKEQADKMANNINDLANKSEEPSYKAFFITHMDSFSITTVRLEINNTDNSYRLFV
jgi:hypothetical protein